MNIYYDRTFVACDDAALKTFTPGHVSGIGMFETLRTCNGQPLFLYEHVQRMSRGLALIGMRNPFSRSQWEALIQQTLSRNHLKDARIRLMAWKDGRRLHHAIVAQPLILPSGETYRNGYALTVSSIVRPLTRLSHVKSTEYQLFLQAHREAQTKNCDDAILLNSRGEVVETSRSNIFWIRKNQVFTPSVDTGCLNGITRQKTMDILRVLRIPVACVRAPLPHLLKAEAALVTNSIIGVMPVARMNHIAMNVRHPFLADIARAYQGLIVAGVLE